MRPDARSQQFPGASLLSSVPTETDSYIVAQWPQATGRKAQAAPWSTTRPTSTRWIILLCDSLVEVYLADLSLFARPKHRTECWIERCLFDDKLCTPDAHISFVPIGVRAEHVTLSFSGLEVSEACSLKRILKALGITLAPTFSRHTTHLLCLSGSGAKLAKAREWGVPVVGMGWLGAMVRGEGDGVPGVEDYLISAAPDAGVDAGVEADAKKTSSKGKGKQKAEDTMGDITNSFDSQESQNQAQESTAFFLPPPPRPAPIASFGQPDASLGGMRFEFKYPDIYSVPIVQEDRGYLAIYAPDAQFAFTHGSEADLTTYVFGENATTASAPHAGRCR
ncbi:hypothetical protein C8J57DRAFT_1521259 [Mycena rebaudengoi]|nr:hypothetical protein C8J57DRAFT_1521259 [Mycena rebaudengoi]